MPLGRGYAPSMSIENPLSWSTRSTHRNPRLQTRGQGQFYIVHELVHNTGIVKVMHAYENGLAWGLFGNRLNGAKIDVDLLNPTRIRRSAPSRPGTTSLDKLTKSSGFFGGQAWSLIDGMISLPQIWISLHRRELDTLRE